MLRRKKREGIKSDIGVAGSKEAAALGTEAPSSDGSLRSSIFSPKFKWDEEVAVILTLCFRLRNATAE